MHALCGNLIRHNAVAAIAELAQGHRQERPLAALMGGVAEGTLTTGNRRMYLLIIEDFFQL
jgi:hypothetical protein